MTIDITNGIRASALDAASEADASDSVVLISQTGTKKVAKRKFLSGYQSNDYSNTGRNLEVVYADEIANYSNVWAWIQARLDAHNVDDLKPGDYILVTLTSGEIVEMQIAGIDTHLNIFSGAVHTHIDWISRDCLATTHNWNTSNDNNGTSTEVQPFMASAVYAWLESEIYPKLPQAVRNVIKGKRLYMPTRYSASGKITDDNSWADKTFPHLWFPFEGEIFDHISWSTKGFGTACCVQYPIFKDSWKARMKRQGRGGSYVHWWTGSATSGYATHAVYVATHGLSTSSGASSVLGVPVCFRTMAAA